MLQANFVCCMAVVLQTTPYYDQPPSFQQQPATAAGAPTATLAGGAPTIEPANKLGGSAPTNYSAG